MSHRAKHVKSSREKDIYWQTTVQFITAVRQIEASSRVAEDNGGQSLLSREVMYEGSDQIGT